MLKKKYLKSKPVCKVTFTLPKEAVQDEQEVRIVGEFNDWNWETAEIMDAGKAEYKATIDLPTGRNFEFRYQLANGGWANDWAADAYVPSPYYGVDNSVVIIDATETGSANGKTDAKAAVATAAAPAKKATKKKATKKSAKDSLKKIEGIGPKIEGLLNEEGIITFADLAKAEISKLKEVLAAAGSRYKMHDPTTWPEQAELAAADEWDKLKVLQEELKGGKR